MALYYDKPDPEAIRSRRVAILGYGNQGRAHALNLRDSGVQVVVGARSGKGADAAADAGFEVLSISEAAEHADFLVLSLPDTAMAGIYRDEIAPHLKTGQVVDFVHGFNITYGLITPPSDVDVVMVSPKGAGYGVRKTYEDGSGVPALVAVHQDFSGRAEELALSYAWALGCFRSNVVLKTTFRQETVTDLFGEQAVLCGGMIDLIKAAYETLVERGYEPEAAYFECLHETKLIVDLLVAKGLYGLRQGISDTAEWGGYLAGAQVVNESSRAAMRSLLDHIEDGSFAQDWVMETAKGMPNLLNMREEEAHSDIEQVGQGLRRRISGT